MLFPFLFFARKTLFVLLLEKLKPRRFFWIAGHEGSRLSRMHVRLWCQDIFLMLNCWKKNRALQNASSISRLLKTWSFQSVLVQLWIKGLSLGKKFFFEIHLRILFVAFSWQIRLNKRGLDFSFLQRAIWLQSDVFLEFNFVRKLIGRKKNLFSLQRHLFHYNFKKKNQVDKKLNCYKILKLIFWVFFLFQF